MTQLVRDLLKKSSCLSIRFFVNQPPPLPSPPLFFCHCERIVYWETTVFMAVVFVIYITQAF